MSLAAGDYQPAEVTYADAGNEKSSFSLFGSVLTAGNIVAKSALFATLRDAANAITLGNVVKTDYAALHIQDWDQPTNGANRETKLLVQYKDGTNGKRYTCTLPTLDPTIPEYIQNINVRDAIAIDSPTEIADFVTAFEAFAVAPDDPTHAVEVLGLRVVGRNI